MWSKSSKILTMNVFPLILAFSLTSFTQQFDLKQENDGNLQVVWDREYRPKSRKSKEKTKSWFRSQIRRLLRLKLVDWNFDYDEKDPAMTQYEWDTIWKFVDANIEAMSVAMESLEDKDKDSGTCSNDADSNGTCRAAAELEYISPYDMLEYEWDDLPYAQDTCHFEKWMKGYKKSYPIIEEVETMYQDLIFKEHPGHDDICMELDRIVQVSAVISCPIFAAD